VIVGVGVGVGEGNGVGVGEGTGVGLGVGSGVGTGVATGTEFCAPGVPPAFALVCQPERLLSRSIVFFVVLLPAGHPPEAFTSSTTLQAPLNTFSQSPAFERAPE